MLRRLLRRAEFNVCWKMLDECERLLVFSRLRVQRRRWAWMCAVGQPLIIGA
jgi:hypothetical protein